MEHTITERLACKRVLRTDENVLTESELAEVIDKWYNEWRDRLVDYKNGTHSFRIAKEELKGRIERYPFE